MTTTDRLDDQIVRDTQRYPVVEATSVPAAQAIGASQSTTGGGDPELRGGQPGCDARSTSDAADPTPRPPIGVASTRQLPPGGDPISDGQRSIDIHRPSAVAPTQRDRTTPPPVSTDLASGLADPTPHPANLLPTSIDAAPGGDLVSDGHAPVDSQRRSAVAPNPPGPAIGSTDSKPLSPVLADPLLAIVADILDDLERVRIANENRYRQLTRHESDSDDEVRGFGLSPDNPAVQSVAKLVQATKLLELEAENNLKRMMRKHALGPWVKGLTGVGEKQAARLLAVVGDPTWHSRDDRPRTVSELRSYCGWGDARAQVRRRGEKANWSDTAKKRTWVIAESCMKQIKDPCKSTRPEGQVWAEHGEDCKCSPFRVVYDNARQKYEGSLHDIECRRCGPKGKPALAGSPRSDGHIHAMCLRAVCKAILKSMWQEGRRLRGEVDE